MSHSICDFLGAQAVGVEPFVVLIRVPQDAVKVSHLLLLRPPEQHTRVTGFRAEALERILRAIQTVVVANLYRLPYQLPNIAICDRFLLLVFHELLQRVH